MYNRRTGAAGAAGSETFPSTGPYAGGTAGTSGFATGGVDTPSGSTASEF